MLGLAIALLAAAPAGMAEDWVLVSTGGKPGDMGGFVVERDSIGPLVGGKRKARFQLITYTLIGDIQAEFDCTGLRWRPLSGVLTENGQTETRPAEDWDPVDPDTSIGWMLRFVCSGGTERGDEAADIGKGDPVEPVRKLLRERE